MNVSSAVKHNVEITGHDMHPNNTSILETGVKTKDKRLFLESLHSFLDTNFVNERALFPRVTSLRGMNIDVFATYFHSVTCRVQFFEEDRRGRSKFSLKRFLDLFKLLLLEF